MCWLTTLLAAQMMVGKAGDPLMRPAIPDPYLMRQQWVQDDLQLSSAQQAMIAEEIRHATGSLPGRGPKKTEAVANAYKGRILQLSIWANDVFALTNEWVQSKAGLDAATRKRVDGISREFFRWYQAESDRLNQRSPGGDIYKAQRFRSPDEMTTLKKVLETRKQMRRAVPASAMAALERLRGPAPHTATPFGFPRSAPYLFMPYVPDALANPRVHEELGFSMKESRLTSEILRGAGDARQRVFAKLSTSQKARLRQLELQMAGTRAILYHDVLAALRVDPDQLDAAYLRLAGLARESQNVQNEEQQAYSEMYASRADPASQNKRRDKIWDDYLARRQAIDAKMEATILGLLSPSQVAKWKQLQGSIVPELAPRR